MRSLRSLWRQSDQLGRVTAVIVFCCGLFHMVVSLFFGVWYALPIGVVLLLMPLYNLRIGAANRTRRRRRAWAENYEKYEQN